MGRPRLDPEVMDAPTVGAAVTGAVYRRVMDLAAEMGSKSDAIRELLSLGIQALDTEGRAPPDQG